ncbi:MAG TPA: hypothetical protein VML55_19300 [Planctomycetaceae bacterium]|nr:hypothetical protein [Planctomycetaceae bacterium]
MSAASPAADHSRRESSITRLARGQRPRLRPVRILQALAAGWLLALLASPAGGQSRPSEAGAAGRPVESTRENPQPPVRALLARLHHADPRVVQQVEDELRGLGASERELQLGRGVFHPDPQVRIALAQALADVEPASRNGLLYELLADSSHQVRIAALETTRAIDPDEPLRNRASQLATADPNPLVRGYARLLVADWNDRRPWSANTARPGPIRQSSASDSHIRAVDSRWNPPQSLAEPSSWREPAPPGGTISGLRPVQPFWLHGASDEQLPLEGPLGGLYDPAGPLPPAPQPAGPSAAGGGQGIGAGDPLFGSSTGLGPQAPAFGGSPIQPDILQRPIEPPLVDDVPPLLEPIEPLLLTGREAPLGFSGPSGVLPSEGQVDSHFVPVEDRWRVGFPEWDRYGKGHPPLDDYPYVEGHWWDPYNQNVLKGDYPIIGQHTFLNITASTLMLHELRELPTPTTPFESTVDPFQEEFFGDPESYFYQHFFSVRFDLFHGNTAFKPLDWQVRLRPVFNLNYLDTNELAVVNPDVRAGTTRFRQDWAMEEYFLEVKLADLSPDYDFASLRAGSQFFTSDFRGFIFSDTNRAIRLFGTRLSNRDQFNIIFFDQTEKETNSELNTFDDRHQNTLIANYYRQDFIFPGYTAQLSFHYNHDHPSFLFDRNRNLNRPDPAGVFKEHEVQAYYFGITGDGHIGRINITNAFYIARGEDHLNPLQGRPSDIKAEMAALELSYDRDWIRFRTSYFYASGDNDIHDDEAEGFDTIFDNPNFAGGEFTFWQRQAIRLFGVNLVQRKSLVPNMRSSKLQGQSNFVNPGLHLVNVGMDFEITPRLKLITNANHLWFDSTAVLEQFVFQDRIRPEVGYDLSIGAEYRPFHNDNAIFVGGFAMLIPGNGMDDLFGITDPFFLEERDRTSVPAMYAAFIETILTF